MEEEKKMLEGVLTAQIASISKTLADLRSDFREHNNLERIFQKTYYENRSELFLGIARAHSRLDDLEPKIGQILADFREINDKLSPLLFTNKVILFVGSTIMLSIIALIWAIILGQVTLIFN